MLVILRDQDSGNALGAVEVPDDLTDGRDVLLWAMTTGHPALDGAQAVRFTGDGENDSAVVEMLGGRRVLLDGYLPAVVHTFRPR